MEIDTVITILSFILYSHIVSFIVLRGAIKEHVSKNYKHRQDK